VSGRRWRRSGCAVFALVAVLASAGCERRAIRFATTTSTENSGLLDILKPAFEKRHGIRLDVIAVGTGRAIRHGENGDVDAILVHSRAAEERFVEQGFGVDRRDVMHNDFVILGPAGDPAGVRGARDAAAAPFDKLRTPPPSRACRGAAALAKIAASRSPFVSRGDDSGTHKKEMSLWREAGVAPDGAWYVEAGQGMGACLVIAHEKRAYVLADRGTYLAYKDKIEIGVLVEGDPRLRNPYGVIAVNPERHPRVKYDEATTFIEWLTSAEAQALIAEFKVGGEQLFHPDAAGREAP
jgi:tungstate transport system substrate-binding protein